MKEVIEDEVRGLYEHLMSELARITRVNKKAGKQYYQIKNAELNE